MIDADLAIDPERNVYHVYPQYGREHDTDGGDCWCSPRRKPVVESWRVVGYLIVHREDN